MNKEQANINKQQIKNKELLHETQQQSRKLDLLLAEAERQAKRIKNLQDATKPVTAKNKHSKSPQM